MAKPFCRLSRFRRLRLETLECRHLLAALTLTTTADGMVVDTNHDGVFDSVNSTSASITNRWFNPPTTPAQERGVFEFDLRDIAAGSAIESARFSYHVSSFTSGNGSYPQFVLRAYAGDGAVTLADATAPAITLGTGEIRGIGVNSVEVDAAVLEPFLGQRLTVRLENTESMGHWAVFSALETVTHGFRTQLLLEVSEPKPLDVQISPDGIWESAGAGAATGTVTRTGDLGQPMVVSLSSSDPSSATVPATVTIPAGSASATFPVDAVDDFFADGDKLVSISASDIPDGQLILDAAYGTTGLVQTSLALQPEFRQATIAPLANGKVLIAGQADDNSWQIIRLNLDGTLDHAFGNNGVVTTVLQSSLHEYVPLPTSIAIQPNGDFLVGGKYGEPYRRGILVRYKANGTLDATFGVNGRANLNMLHVSSNAGISDIALRPDGRILLGFTEYGPTTGVVAQLMPDGTLDLTFGNGGFVRLNGLYGTGFSSSQVEILDDGSFLVAGALQRRAGVVRVQENGLGLVTSFGTDGISLANFRGAMVELQEMQLDSQGRIILAGSAASVVDGRNQPQDFAVARFLSDGSPDLLFADSGVKRVDVANSSDDIATSLVIQPGDKITLGGASSVADVTASALVRLNADGTPDASFSPGGVYRDQLSSTFADDMIFDLAQQASGNLLVLTGWEVDWAYDVRLANFKQPRFASVTVYDDDPTAYSSEYSIDEDRVLIAQLLAIDPDDDLLQFAVMSPPSSGTVTINNPATGSFTYVPDPNFHGSDAFTFRVNDGQANSNVATVVITVNPVNDPPVIMPGSFTLPEDAPGGTVVGTVAASDVEDDGLSFSIVSGNTGNAFAIDAASGEIRVANAAALDFATTPFFPLVVRVVDASGLGGTAAISIFLTEVVTQPMSAPPVIGAFPTSVVKYTENAAAGVIGGGTVTDIDSLDFDGGTLTVSLTAGATADDQLGIRHIGFGAKQIGVDGDQITYGTDGTQENALPVATFSGGVGSEPLMITFNSDARAAQVTAVLRAVTFHNLSETPVAGLRQVSFVITDGDGGSSEPVTRELTVVAKNDAPVVITSASEQSYTEGDEPVVIDAAITVFDVDSSDFDTGILSVAIAAGAQRTDRLGIQNSGPIRVDVLTAEVSYLDQVIGTFSGTTTLIVKLNAQATAEAVQALMRRVTFSSISAALSADPRSINFRLTDGDGGRSAVAAAATVMVTPQNDAPAISGVAGTEARYAENAAPLALASSATVVDPDLLDFSGGTLTVTLSTGATADDQLGIRHIGFGAKQIGVDGDQITYGTDGTQENALPVATFSGGVGSEPLMITFNSDARAAQVTAVLRAVTFRNLSETPVAGLRQVSFVITDGDGGSSEAVTRELTVVAKNDAPVVITSASEQSYTEGDEPVVIDAAITVFDVDSSDFDTGILSVAIAAGAQRTDRLGIQSSGPIRVDVLTAEVSYLDQVIGTFSGTTTLIVKLNAQATAEAVQALMRRVTFSSISAALSADPRSINFRLTDGDGGRSEAAAAATVMVTPQNDAPTISSFPTSVVSYKKQAAPVVVGGGTVTDADLLDFDGGTILAWLGGADPVHDRLGIKHTGFGAKQIGVDGNHITYGTDGTLANALPVATFSGGVGDDLLVITFNSNARATQVTAVLRAISYSNLASNPLAGLRQVTFLLSDGDGAHAEHVTRNVNLIL